MYFYPQKQRPDLEASQYTEQDSETSIFLLHQNSKANNESIVHLDEVLLSQGGGFQQYQTEEPNLPANHYAPPASEFLSQSNMSNSQDLYNSNAYRNNIEAQTSQQYSSNNQSVYGAQNNYMHAMNDHKSRLGSQSMQNFYSPQQNHNYYDFHTPNNYTTTNGYPNLLPVNESINLQNRMTHNYSNMQSMPQMLTSNNQNSYVQPNMTMTTQNNSIRQNYANMRSNPQMVNSNPNFYPGFTNLQTVPEIPSLSDSVQFNQYGPQIMPQTKNPTAVNFFNSPSTVLINPGNTNANQIKKTVSKRKNYFTKRIENDLVKRTTATGNLEAGSNEFDDYFSKHVEKFFTPELHQFSFYYDENYIYGIQMIYRDPWGKLDKETYKGDLHMPKNIPKGNCLYSTLNLDFDDYLTELYVDGTEYIKYIKLVTAEGQMLEIGRSENNGNLKNMVEPLCRITGIGGSFDVCLNGLYFYYG